MVVLPGNRSLNSTSMGMDGNHEFDSPPSPPLASANHISASNEITHLAQETNRANARCEELGLSDDKVADRVSKALPSTGASARTSAPARESWSAEPESPRLRTWLAGASHADRTGVGRSATRVAGV